MITSPSTANTTGRSRGASGDAAQPAAADLVGTEVRGEQRLKLSHVLRRRRVAQLQPLRGQLRAGGELILERLYDPVGGGLGAVARGNADRPGDADAAVVADDDRRASEPGDRDGAVYPVRDDALHATVDREVI